MLIANLSFLAVLLSTPPQDSAPPVLPDVEVVARPTTQRMARDYVDAVSNPPFQAFSLATWRRSLCIEVVNLQDDAALVLKACFTARAQSLGLEVHDRGCHPNVSVFFTTDGAATAKALVDANADGFHLPSGMPQPDKGDLERFVSDDTPVRWWLLAADFDTYQNRFMMSQGTQAAVRYSPGGEIYFNQSLARAVLRTVVVIDVSLTRQVPTEALADYLAMVSLAEIDPLADTMGFPTILNLWRDPAPELALTAWDEGYLDALYKTPVRLSGGQATPRSLYQLNEMARQMATPVGSSRP